MSGLFAERVAAVRPRFVAKLAARIDEIESSILQLGREGGLDTLVLAHLHVHNLYGVGAFLGYARTGEIAGSIERVLLAAIKAERMPTNDEIAHLRDGIALLRFTAAAEMHPASAEPAYTGIFARPLCVTKAL
jgi:hypothetical protein